MLSKKDARNRRRKGSYQSITAQVGMIAFAGALIALIAFVQTSLIKIDSDMRILENDIHVVDAAHIVKECLISDGSIPLQLLADGEKDRKSVCSLCPNLCSFGTGARVEVLEGPKGSYDFGYSSSDSTHRIFVTVNDGQKSYVSRLMVSYSGKAGPIASQTAPPM